jgi:flagellar protein FliO/FliZ
MDFLSYVRAAFALALTLGLIGLAAVALRKYGPDAMARFALRRKDRRLKLVETLVIDPARRVVIVDCDGRERLILLGEGRILADLPGGASER